MKNFKRLLSFVLMLCMMLSLVPAVSFGASAAGSYVKTDLSAIGASDVVVITMTTSDGKTYALSSANGTSSAPTAVAVTVSGNSLSGTIEDQLLWNISKNGDDLTIYPNGDNTKWLYCTDTNNGVRVGGTNANKVFTLDASSGYLKNTATSRYVGVYTTNPDWRCYTSTTTNIDGQTLAFYKLEAGNTPDPGYTVTFSTPDGVTAPDPDTGSSIMLPGMNDYTDAENKEYSFVGWVTGTYSDASTKPGTIYKAGDDLELTGDITLNALYSWSETVSSGGGSTSSYKKVTSVPSNWAGTYLIVYEGGNLALNGSLTSVDASNNTVSVTISGDSIAATTDLSNATVTIAAVTDGYSIKTASGYYIGQSSDANGLKSSTSTVYVNSLTMNDDGTANIVSGGAYLRYNATSGQERFRYYKSATYTEQKAITLYKLESTSGDGTTTNTYWTTEISGAACDHSITKTEGAKEATCTAEGYTGDTVCANCGELIQAGAVIPATGHSYADGSCTVCGAEDPDTTNYSGRYYIATKRATGNYWYMTNNLGTSGTKRYQAENTGLSTLPTAIDAPNADKVFVVERNEDGTYCIYAEAVDGDNYLGWSSGHSGILVSQDAAKNVTINGIGDGLVNIYFTAGSENRYLSLNNTSGNDYFAWYAGTQQQNLALIPVTGSSVSNEITITLVCPNGASAESVTAEAGASIQLPVPTGGPETNGFTHTFYGWADKEVSDTKTLPSIVTVYNTNDSVSFEEDTTLYALYTYVDEEETYYTTITPIVISFICPDGVTADAIHTTTGTHWTMPTPTGAPANNVYKLSFVGWVQTIVTRTETEPSYAKAGNKYYTTSNLTYYPLYSFVSNEKTYYTTINPMTVTFHCPMGVSAETIHTTTGTVYTIPTPDGTPTDAAQEYTFAGWVTSPVSDTSTEPTTIIPPGARYGATGSMNYYALYTYTQDSTTVYTSYVRRNTTVYRIDTEAQLISGNYLIMADASGANKTYPGYYMLPEKVDGFAVLSSESISFESVPAEFDVVSTVLWTMNVASDGTVTIQDSNGRYLADTSGDSSVGISFVTTPYSWTPDFSENGTFTLKSASGRYLSLRSDFSNVEGDVFCVASNISTGCTSFYLYKESCFHTETTTETVAPTCTTAGSETVTCNICGEVISTTEIPAVGHTFVDSGEDRDGMDVYVCSVCGIEELRDNTTASIKIITGEGTAWFVDSEGNVYPLCDDDDNALGTLASEKSIAYRARVPKDSSVTLVIVPDADQRLACIEKNSNRLDTDEYTYHSDKGYFTYNFNADPTNSGANNFFRITFLPRLADGGYYADQASEAEEGAFITPGLYVMTGISELTDIKENDHNVDTTYLLYGDQYTVLDDDLKAVGRKSSALQLSSVGVFLNTEPPYRMTAVNKNHLVDIQPNGDYFTIEMYGARHVEDGSELHYYLMPTSKSSDNHLYTSTEVSDETLWSITYLSDGAYQIVNKAYPTRQLRFNSKASNLQFRPYNSSEGHAPVLYRATKASQLVTYSVTTGSNSGSIRATNSFTASVFASGTYQAIGSVLKFTFTPAFGYMLDSVVVNGEAVEVNNGSYTCTVIAGEDIDIKVSYVPIPATNDITVYFYVNDILQDGHTITETVANTYTLNLEGLPEVPINGVNYKYSELSFNYAENKTTKEIYSDIHAAILVDDGHEIHVYFTTTKVTLNKTAIETTDRNYEVDDTNGGVNNENFTVEDGGKNQTDDYGNVKQSFEITLSAQSFDKGEDISYGNTDVIVVLDNSNSMHFKDSPTVSGALSAASSTENRLSVVGADDVDNNAVWTISIDGYAAVVQSQGSYTRNTLAYDSESEEFSAYASDNSMRQVIIWRYNASTEAFENVTDVSELQDEDLVTFTDFYYDSSDNPVYSVYMDAGTQNENGAHPPVTTSSLTSENVFTLLELDNGGYMFYSAGTKVPGKTNAEYTMAALDSFYDQVFEIPGNRIGFVKFESQAYAWNGNSYIAYAGSRDPSSYSFTYANCFVTNKADATIASNAAIAQMETAPLAGATNMVGAWLMTDTLCNLFDGKNGRDLVIVFFTDGVPTATYVTDSNGEWSTSTISFQHPLTSYDVSSAGSFYYGDSAKAEGTYELSKGTYPFIGNGGKLTSAMEYHDALSLAQDVRSSLKIRFDNRFSIHNIGLFNEYADEEQKIDYPELIDWLLCERDYDPQGNLSNQTKQWNTEDYPRGTLRSITSTSSNRKFFTMDSGYIRVMKDDTTKSYYVYGDAGLYLDDTSMWIDTEPYADSYVSVTGNVEQELEAAFAAIGEITIPGKRVNGTITDIIPDNFELTDESREALVNSGWTVTKNSDGTTTLTSPVVTADEDGESFTYEIVYQGYGYGVEYTNDLATYTYNGIEEGQNKQYTAYFPMPAVDVIPWTVNDGYTADTNVAVTLDIFKNDLFKELTAGGYTVGNLTVTLTDANGNPTTYSGAQVGEFDAVVDPASNTVSFMTETGGTHTFYYVVSAEVTDPEGGITTVYSRATRVDVLTVTAENVSDVGVVMVGDDENCYIDLLANDSFDSGDNDASNHVVLTDANGNTLEDDMIPSITNVEVDPGTGRLTYTAVESGVAEFWYVNTITAESENGGPISVSTPPTKVTILVVDNAALVVDYGYTTEDLRVHPDISGYTVAEGVSLSQVVSISYTDVTDQFGTAAFSDGSFRFTPETTMFGGTAVFSYDVTMKENTYSIRAANYAPTVTVVPANSIYFEESFLNYVAVGGEEKALAGWTNANDEPADERLQSNENKLYGYDNAYLVSEAYSGGAAKLATVDEENHTAVAYFTFSGTGFDLYGLSSDDTGFLLAEIYTYNSEKENNLGTLKKYVMVDTYIKGKYYDQLPILCYRADDPGDYAVKLRVVYERAFDHNLVATKSVGIRDEDYYRQLLGLQEGIPMELNLSQSTTHATRSVPDAALGSYSVVIDGLRVYQPLGINPDDSVANKLYEDAGELGMSFFRLRNLLLNSEDWIEGDVVNGLVYIAAHGSNSQTSGSATDAPESSGFYMTPTQLLKLDENNYLIDPTTKAPFLYKNETDGQEYKVFVVIVEGADGGYRYDFCYKNSLDETVVIPAEEIEEAGLMHSENYYEAVGPKYELYLTDGNGVAFDVTGSTVHISAKVPSGSSADLMAYVDGAWSKVATVTSKTELYFDVSEYINSDGSLIIKCEAEGDDVLSLCNLKTNGTTSISRRTLCNAAVAINGLKANDTDAPTEAADLVFETKSLSLRSYIAFNCFVSASVLANYDNWYVVFERYDYDTGDVVSETVLGADFFGASYQFEYKVNSYQMSDTITATLYAVKDGKTYVGETYTNSVADYVYSNIEFAENDAHATLYANLVTYGAKAQIYMNYNVENLADAKLGEYASYVTNSVPTAESVFSQTATMDAAAVTLNTFALGIPSAVEIQVILNQPVGYDMADLYGEMTFVNSSGETVTQRVNGADFDDFGVVLIGRFDALTAVDGRTPVEITIYDQDGNAVSDTWTYSIASYLDGTTLEGDALATLYALINYFDSAAAYFNG